MDRKGFIDFNTRLSPENSGKADSYARAIMILDEVLPYQNVIDLQGRSLYELSDVTAIDDVLRLVNEEVKKMKNQQQNIFDDYGGRCALTGISVPQLLLASHIIPWADKSHKKDRLNPCNGICLSALYDKAFDKGLFTISPDDYTIQLSSALREYGTQEYFDKQFGSISGKQIAMPIDYKPNRDFLAYHRDHVFVGI
jgi:hypothetical protein